MLAFPQEKISHYTTDLVIDIVLSFVQLSKSIHKITHVHWTDSNDKLNWIVDCTQIREQKLYL